MIKDEPAAVAVCSSADSSFHLLTSLTERKVTLIEPQSFCPQFQVVLSKSRGVNHLEDVTPLSDLPQVVENFLGLYYVSHVYPTR